MCKNCLVKDLAYNCDSCKENRGMSGKYPCGQQNCWYSCKVGETKNIYTGEIECRYEGD